MLDSFSHPTDLPPTMSARMDAAPMDARAASMPPDSKPDPRSADARPLDTSPIVVLTDEAGLRRHVADWDDLAAHAAEPNVFYEPWMLLPAVRQYGAGKNLCFVLVYAPKRAAANSPRILVGFFPFERGARFHGLAVPALALWNYPYCYLATPLVRTGYAEICLRQLLSWQMSPASGAKLVEFYPINADGRFNRTLLTQAEKSGAVAWAHNLRTRALFRPAENAEVFLQSALGGRHRKELRRQYRRLLDSGSVEVRHLPPDGDIAAWIDAFIALEKRGWKGRDGIALAMNPPDEIFFRDSVLACFADGRLLGSELLLDGRPIAMKCSFLAPPRRGPAGSFAFKITFDEEFSRYSPGMMLEILTVRHLHEHPIVDWMDSCAATDHFMINRLWPDRRPIHSVMLARAGGLVGFLVMLMPLRQFFRRSMGLG